jgi:large subunit ribosomal protein L23
MALFSRSKKTTEETAVTTKVVTKAKAIDRDLSTVIVAPVVTEKAVMAQDRKVYVFYVRKDATKRMVAEAIAAVYKVTPVSVNIVNKMTKSALSRSRGRVVTTRGYKKAYVYLKSSDSITIA